MNVFDWPGPKFLVFYEVLLLLTAAAAWILRCSLRGPFDDAPPGTAASIDFLSAAYLAGGPRQVVRAALASLVQRDVLRISKDKTPRLSAAQYLPDDASEVEAAIYEHVQT